MEIIFLFFVLIIQNAAIFLDNLGVFYLVKNHQSKRLARTFAKKNQIDFLSRGFLFFSPPLLGYLIANNDLYLLLLIFVLSSFLSLIITIVQSLWLLSKFNYHFRILFNYKSLFLLFVGFLLYSIYLYVPFYLNILAYFFIDQGLWLVQLSPLLTVITSVFVVYYMDPKIAQFIDSIDHKNPNIIFEMIAMRVIGRASLVFISIFLFFQFSI
jgi:hypothetical protein